MFNSKRLKILFTILLGFLSFLGNAQLSEKRQVILDSLNHELEIAKTDTNLCIVNHRLGKFHFSKSRNLVLASTYLFKALEIAQRNNYEEIEAVTYDVMAWMEDRKGNYLKAVQYMRLACDYYRTTDRKTYVFAMMKELDWDVV